MPFISLIIPIYNAEKYLRRCLESVRSQDFPDMEVLLVNDGSVDGSLEICREYEKKDSRFQVLDKKNTGVSNSRNLAMKLASGTYLQFMDSDDWLEKDAVRNLAEAAKSGDCDLVVADFYRVDGAVYTEKQHIRESGILDRKTYAAYMMKEPADYYYGVMWNKLYRAQIIRENGLTLDEDLCWCEDFLFNLAFLRRAERILAIQTPVYYYYKRRGSLANSEWKKPEALRLKFRLLEMYKGLYQELGLYEENKLKINAFVVSVAKDGAVNPMSRKKQLLEPENYIEDLPPEYVRVRHGFGPEYDENSRILILGTFPSVKSREEQFYYAHKQNRFWKLLARLFEEEEPKTLEEKKALLRRNKVALWDVVDACDIKGSSDSSIKNVVPSDINRILRAAPVEKIIANGDKAYRLYRKYCEKQTGREILKCPSTSPANAIFSLERLEREWRKACFGEEKTV